MSNEIQEMNVCGRAEQLVGYLYGESNAQERASFELHLADCPACRGELAAFGQVRESVGAWRAELLAHAPGFVATDVIPAALLAEDDSRLNARNVPLARRSAWDALREFLVLSPAWLRFGTVAAALVVCTLAALAVANAEVGRENGNLVFRTGVWRTTAANPSAPTRAHEAGEGSAVTQLNRAQLTQAQLINQAQLDQLIAERDAARRELEDARAQLDDSRAANIEAVYHDIEESQPVAAPPSAQTSQGVSRQRHANVQRKSVRRATGDEEDLPRLLDLLGSGN